MLFATANLMITAPINPNLNCTVPACNGYISHAVFATTRRNKTSYEEENLGEVQPLL